MRRLTASALLALWEDGARRHPLDRAILALRAAFPEIPGETLADWSLGRRNRALLELRRSCFGDAIRGWTTCQHCGERLEFELDAGALVAGGESAPGDSETIVIGARHFRLVNSRDLAAAADASDPETAARRIAQSCYCGPDGGASLSDDELRQIGDAMAVADPLAETRLRLCCPQCDRAWDETLDLVDFVWTELEARAYQLLAEVDAIARAYGWTEREILSLGERRRAGYLELIGA
jgi:hypothetical protein